MRMHNEQEINSLAEEKINIELEWEANIEAEEGAQYAERNEFAICKSEEEVQEERDKVILRPPERNISCRLYTHAIILVNIISFWIKILLIQKSS